MDISTVKPTAAPLIALCCADDASEVSTTVPKKGAVSSAPTHNLLEHSKVERSKVNGLDPIPPALPGNCLVSSSRGLVRVQTLGNPHGASRQPLLIDVDSTP